MGRVDGGPAADLGEVWLGEIVTALPDTSGPLPTDTVRGMLEAGGRPAAWKGHPLPRAVSPSLYIGVDCPLAADRSRQVRGVGTVGARMVATGGHVIQGSAQSRVRIGRATGRNEDWSHYSDQVGVVEVIGRASADGIADGFLTAPTDPGRLDLQAVAARAVGRIQGHPALDHNSRLVCRPTRLRWAALVSSEPLAPRAAIELDGEDASRIRLVVHADQADRVQEFCEVFGLHQWLLATLKGANERSARTVDPVGELSVALEYLAHLWNPAAHLTSGFRELWLPLETDGPQFSWQWQTQVSRMRDKLASLTRTRAEERLRTRS